MLLPLFTGHWPFLPQVCISNNSTQKQICLMSWPIEAIAEINVWSDFCCGRQLVATYFYVSQEGGAGLVSWGTVSGSDGVGLSGEKARASWLTPSARRRAASCEAAPGLDLPYQCQCGHEVPRSPRFPHIHLQLLRGHLKCLPLDLCQQASENSLDSLCSLVLAARWVVCWEFFPSPVSAVLGELLFLPRITHRDDQSQREKDFQVWGISSSG